MRDDLGILSFGYDSCSHRGGRPWEICQTNFYFQDVTIYIYFPMVLISINWDKIDIQENIKF